MPVWEIASLREKFDIVLFMGVLYHLRHPLLALDLIHEHVANDLLVFQSLERGSQAIVEPAEDYDFNAPAPFDEPGFPKMHFIEQRYSHDETNWWIPNRACVEAMLRSSGFRIESQPEEEIYLCRRQELVVPPDGPHAVYPSVAEGSGRAHPLLQAAEELLAARRLEEAFAACERAQQAGEDPDRINGCLWMIHMLGGDFEKAWRQSDALRARHAPDPHRLWQGEPIAGKRVVVRCLHGFGDTVQMLRYAPCCEKSPPKSGLRCRHGSFPSQAVSQESIGCSPGARKRPQRLRRSTCRSR